MYYYHAKYGCLSVLKVNKMNSGNSRTSNTISKQKSLERETIVICDKFS